ncbi:hypothetical protein I7I48_07282 [Histoplasma ohiense]|nr:hypothetical protein I7I48_07282 [Histoplasma ohiense (nom. inval.)]
MWEVRRSAFILSLCVLFLSCLSHYFVRPFHVFILALKRAGAVMGFSLDVKTPFFEILLPDISMRRN